MESPEDQVPSPQDEDSTPKEEEASSDPKPRIVSNHIELIEALKEAAEEISEERAKELRVLYGEEEFEDQGITYAEDLAAYDEAAYTRNSQDYTDYRYNLGEVGKAQKDYYYGEQYGLLGDDSLADDPDGLAGDLDAGSLSGGVGSSKYPASGAGTGYYGKGGKGGKGSYSYTGAYSTGGNWGGWTGGWMSSWYRGYNSSERAIEGVHDNVSSFVTARGFGNLEIVPDLEPVDEESTNDPTITRESTTSYANGSLRHSTDKTMVVRIDSTLYEKLGIAEAQQHYVVDAISQILAIQTYEDPFLITLLQAVKHKTVIPSVTKEIITEMMRAKGLPILIDQMPGWMKRVTAFRSAMYIAKPADTGIPAAFLMYAIWERDVVETIEHRDAIKAVEEIEKILSRPAPYLTSGPGLSESFVKSRRNDILIDIDTVLVRYITGHGSAGEILRVLRKMEKLLNEKVEAIKYFVDKGVPVPNATWESGKVFYQESCEMLIPLVHDHNRTFCPNPSDTSVVRHFDFPDCPNTSLLRSEIKGRVEFSRKCLFNLERIPGESIKQGSAGHPQEYNVEVALKRVCDMIQHIEKALKLLLAAAEKASGGGKDGKPDDGRRGTNCTNHPKLRIRNPIGGSTERNFTGEDPAFNREVIVFDSTI